jgi:hypothetical protein
MLPLRASLYLRKLDQFVEEAELIPHAKPLQTLTSSCSEFYRLLLVTA